MVHPTDPDNTQLHNHHYMRSWFREFIAWELCASVRAGPPDSQDVACCGDIHHRVAPDQYQICLASNLDATTVGEPKRVGRGCRRRRSRACNGDSPISYQKFELTMDAIRWTVGFECCTVSLAIAASVPTMRRAPAMWRLRAAST